jgi:hypothetical protein
MILTPSPKQQFFGNNGRPLDGGLLFTYAAGTNNKIDTYSNASGTLNTNPIVLDFRGEANIWLDPEQTYKFVLSPRGDTDPPTNPIWSVDNIEAPFGNSNLTQQFIGRKLWPRTEAEIAADVTPSNYAYPPLNLRRYGGAPGAGDNTSAMDQAEAVCAEQNGGIIVLDTPGEWRMNWVCTTDSVIVQGPGGSGEFDVACIRPHSLTSAPITFGDGSVILRYCRIRDCHVSGTDGTSGAVTQSAKNAPQAIRLYGAVNFRATDCVFYNGLHTIDVQPSATVPVFDIRFLNCKARNDIADSNDARTVYGKSIDNTGFYTDVIYQGAKLEGPDSGYLAEFDGTTDGIRGIFIGGYSDFQPGKGVLLTGNAAIHSWGHDLDPGANGVVIITTNQAQTDPARVIFGYLTQGGQKIEFSGGVQTTLPAEADHFLYKARLQEVFHSASTYFALAADPYSTDVELSLGGASGPLSLFGADFVAREEIIVNGGNASASGLITAVSASGGLFLSAQGTNQNVRLVPSGTGVVSSDATVQPTTDNAVSCGSGSNRWTQVFAATGTINTSDERVKTDIDVIPQEWLDAWSEVQWQRYRYRDAVARKCDGARWHVGLIAQRVIEAFAKRGLDALELGIVCYDEWPAEYEDQGVEVEQEVKDGDGKTRTIKVRVPGGEMKLVREAGNLYAIRYEEALALECAYLRSRLP